MPKVLADLVQVNPPFALPQGMRPDTPVSFIPMSDLTEGGDWSGRQVRVLREVTRGFTAFSDGDVLVAKITPCFENGKGACVEHLTNGIGFGSTEFHVLRPRDGTSSRFVHHLVQSARLRRAGEAFMIGSAGQRRVPRDFFDKYPAPELNSDEQVGVSLVLDTLDTAIRQTEAIIEKLKLVKQGLLHDLLTRGIDDNGELRPPQSEAPHLYKQSALGWIPAQWEVATIRDLLADSDPAMRSGPFGSALLKEELVEHGIPLLGIDNVLTEKFHGNFTRFVTPSKFAQLSRYAVRPRDLMITIMGTVGRCCLVPDDIGRALSSKHTWTITLDKRKYMPVLAMLQVNYSPWALSHFARDEQGGIMSAIRSDTLRALRLPLPPMAEQLRIVGILGVLSQRIEKESAAIAKHGLERSGLMDDLLTGRVRVTPLLAESVAR